MFRVLEEEIGNFFVLLTELLLLPLKARSDIVIAPTVRADLLFEGLSDLRVAHKPEMVEDVLNVGREIRLSGSSAPPPPQQLVDSLKSLFRLKPKGPSSVHLNNLETATSTNPWKYLHRCNVKCYR